MRSGWGPADTGWQYLQHLTDRDLALLAGALPGGPGARDLRSRPQLVEELLGHPRVFETVFGPRGRADPLLEASPFLVFAVAVHRLAGDLGRATFVEEWTGPHRRLPVFDVAGLRDFLADPLRRLFLVELLASYTKVASGSVWVRAGRTWRRRRFSELDPVRLASMLEVVPEGERPGIYRRLGDLALFLTGVFPDHLATRGLGGVEARKLLATAQAPPPEEEPDLGAVGLLEHLGARWYRLASATAPVLSGTMRVVEEVAARFRQARRVLNAVTDRYLFRHRASWFRAPGA